MFDNVPSRRGTNSYKWDNCPNADVLPLWVADMDFPVAPCIQQAIERRAQHPIYGYVRVPDSYYEATIQWFGRRHGWTTMQREWMIPTIGVVPAVSAVIQALTEPGDKVLCLTPVYNCFYSSIRNSGCVLQESRLVPTTVQRPEGPIQTWHVDMEDLERKAADARVKVFLLCNPHNPCGRIWTPGELRQMWDICHRHGITVLSDEIHNELCMPGYRYTPFASVCPEMELGSVTCLSPSKSFNIAGLQNSVIVAADPVLRQRIDRQININEVCDVNPFGVEALQAAYSPQGEEWLRELNAYLYDNYRLLLDTVHQHLPQLVVTELQGTYLAWVDCSALGKPSEQLEEELLQHGVWLNAGTMYDPAGSMYMRINLACPRATLAEAMERIRKAWS